MSEDRGWYYEQGVGWTNDGHSASQYTSANRTAEAISTPPVRRQADDAGPVAAQAQNSIDMLSRGPQNEFAHLTDEGLAEFAGRVHAEITRRQLQRGGGGQ